jgi:hypothetical protein
MLDNGRFGSQSKRFCKEQDQKQRSRSETGRQNFKRTLKVVGFDPNGDREESTAIYWGCARYSLFLSRFDCTFSHFFNTSNLPT